MLLSFVSIFFLPETHLSHQRQAIKLSTLSLKMLQDKKVMTMGMIVAGGNGISFSFFAEGSFYLIDQLGITPILYGLSFCAIALSMLIAGIVSKKLHAYLSSEMILNYGMKTILVGSLVFSLCLFAISFVSSAIFVFISIFCMMIIMAGVCITTANALAIALVDYKAYTGSASSLFGFFYYCLISFFTLGMAWLHNDTLYPMPLYFLAISLFMISVYQFFYSDRHVILKK